jgi:hypothetical protein
MAIPQRLHITVGKVRTILRGTNYPTLFQFADGSILVSAYNGTAQTDQLHVRSVDGGFSWRSCATGLYAGINGCMGSCSDGTVLAMRAETEPVKDKPGTYVGQLWESKDCWHTVSGPEPFYLKAPAIITALGDDELERTGPIFHGRFVTLKNGTLLGTMYTRFPEDKRTTPTGVEWKERTILVQSSDRGRNWEYVSTIACMAGLEKVADPQTVAQWQEGFNEPGIALLPDGKLICLMRTGPSAPWAQPADSYHDLATTTFKDGKYYPTSPLPAGPLYQATSTDGGKTWSLPVSAAPTRGACPRILLLSNGVMAVSYGRVARETQGNGIAFSTDAGKTWTHETVISPNLSSGYTGIAEIEPGKLLMVFDTVTTWPPQYVPDWIGAVDITVK